MSSVLGCKQFIWMGNVVNASKFNAGFIKNYNKKGDEWHVLEVDV